MKKNEHVTCANINKNLQTKMILSVVINVDATDVCESRQQRTYCYRAHRPSSVMILQVYKVSSCNNRIKKTKLEL